MFVTSPDEDGELLILLLIEGDCVSEYVPELLYVIVLIDDGVTLIVLLCIFVKLLVTDTVFVTPVGKVEILGVPLLITV